MGALKGEKQSKMDKVKYESILNLGKLKTDFEEVNLTVRCTMRMDLDFAENGICLSRYAGTIYPNI